MCRLRNIAMHDYQESVTTRQTDAGQSDPYVPLCFAGDTKRLTIKKVISLQKILRGNISIEKLKTYNNHTDLLVKSI